MDGRQKKKLYKNRLIKIKKLHPKQGDVICLMPNLDEIGVGYAFKTDCNKLEKIDCWYQAHRNIVMITHEVLRQYKEQLKKEKE